MENPTDFSEQIEGQLKKQSYNLTPDQDEALHVFRDFLKDEKIRTAMVLKGAAGTGKTFLINLIARSLERSGWKVFLLAPTGRSAKVITRRAGKYAATLHRHIYNVLDSESSISFSLKENRDAEKTFYIVDEASMLGGGEEGKGRSLLQDLVDFVYDGFGKRKLLMVGDPAQLPPVGSSLSPALEPAILRKKYFLNVYETEMTNIMRQAAHSDILVCSSLIRENMNSTELPLIEPTWGQDISKMESGDETLETFIGLYESDNPDKVVVITYSNRMAVRINQALRMRMFETEEPIVEGERIMVVKNNYSFFDKRIPFIANGESGIVRWVYKETRETKYGLNWMDVGVEFIALDGEPHEIRCKIVLDLLSDKTPQLDAMTLRRIAMERRKELSETAEGLKKETFNKDPYITALQVKYAYAVTGHKSQGGQWNQVIVAFEPIYPGMNLSDYIRWAYTAVTRAEEKLYLFGWPFGKRNAD